MEIKENLVRKQGVRKGVLAYIDPPLKFPPPRSMNTAFLSTMVDSGFSVGGANPVESVNS